MRNLAAAVAVVGVAGILGWIANTNPALAQQYFVEMHGVGPGLAAIGFFLVIMGMVIAET